MAARQVMAARLVVTAVVFGVAAPVAGVTLATAGVYGVAVAVLSVSLVAQTVLGVTRRWPHDVTIQAGVPLGLAVVLVAVLVVHVPL